MNDVPLKRWAAIVAGQSPPSTDVDEFDERGLPFLQGNAEFGTNCPRPRLMCESAPKRAQPGDILISVRAPVGALNRADREYGIGRGLAAIRPHAELDRDFAWWYLHSAIPTLRAEATGSTYEAVAADDIGELRLPAVDRQRQRAIADYLDTETARIDALIAKKRKLAQSLEARLLEEARTLVVGGHRLVDALNVRQEELSPGWRALKLGRHLRFGSGTTPTSGDPRYYGPGVPWIVTGDLRDLELTHVGRSVTEAAFGDFSALKVHPAGSLIVAMYGATVGRLGLTTFPAAVNQACSVLEMRDGLDLRFLFFFLLAHRPVLLERCVGAGQPNISQDILRSLRIPAPSLPEQRRIADSIEKSRARNGNLVSRLDRQVALLQEHRQALITAAVTGELEIPRVAS